MGKMNDEETVLGLSNAWNDAYMRRDIMALEKILADDWVCIDGSGELIGKLDLLERVRLSPGFLKDARFDETSVKMLDSAAVVTGRLSGIMNDEDGTFELVQRYMRVFAKRDGEWQAVATQVTIAKQEKI
jgi:Domain of unknown function (DUF4440)